MHNGLPRAVRRVSSRAAKLLSPSGRMLLVAIALLAVLGLAFPVALNGRAQTAVSQAPPKSVHPSRAAASLGPSLDDLRAAYYAGTKRAFLQQAALNDLHDTFWLHGVGSQLYTAWNAPITLKALNWYGFEYAPFVPDGLDRASLDTILSSLHTLGFNALRVPFANETVEINPIVTEGLAANPDLRGLHSLDIMERIIQRAHHFGLRVILCNSRSEAGRGPEIKSGLWYTDDFPESAWFNDWMTLVKRFRSESAFVGADLRNEPHITGHLFDLNAYVTRGPLWGAYNGTYYHDRDWHYAAETMGNALLAINPRLLIIVEGVQMYLDPDRNVLTGGLWGGNLVGVQYDPVVLTHASQLVYSVHEYGPHMWQGNWFTLHTTYQSLARRWDHLWGYLLATRKELQAPIFVGEFGTCHNYYSCVTSDQGWKQGFWFKSFVRYLREHRQVGWAYWALNPQGPFHPQDSDFYSLVSADWRHYFPLLTRGLAPLLSEPNGLWNPVPRAPIVMTPQPGCSPSRSCSFNTDTVTPVTLPRPPRQHPPRPSNIRVAYNVPYVSPADPIHRGDLYLPLGQQGPRPAVILLHGRTWNDGRKGAPGTVAMAQGLASHGYVVFDINYRLVSQGGGFPHDVQDVKDAVAFLGQTPEVYHVDPLQIGIVGAGSGGYLAMMAAYTPHQGDFIAPHYPNYLTRVAAVAAFAAPANLVELATRGTDAGELQSITTYLGSTYAHKPSLYSRASVAQWVNTASDTIFFHAENDLTEPFGETFHLYRDLRQRIIPTQLVDLPGVPHGFGDMSVEVRHRVQGQITDFFDSIFYRPKLPPTS